MTTKQILLSIFMLGTINTIGLAMEKKIIPTEERAIFIDRLTPKGEKQHVKAKVFNYAIFKKNRQGICSQINIIKDNNGTYIFQGTISTLNFLYPYPKTEANLEELYYTVKDLMDPANANNAILCDDVSIEKDGFIRYLTRTIITNTKDPIKCLDIFQLYQEELKNFRQGYYNYYDDEIKLPKEYSSIETW